LQLLRNIGQNNEWTNSKQWYSSKKDELAKSQEKPGGMAVNQEAVLNDYMEKNVSEYSKAVLEMYGKI